MKLIQRALRSFRPLQIRSNHAINRINENNKTSYTIDTFDKSNDCSKLQIINDNDIGGISKGRISYSEEDQAVTALGQVVVDKSKELQRLPFVGIEYDFPTSFNVADFRTLKLHLRTDGTIIKVNLYIKSTFDFGNHSAYAYIVDQSQQWNTYEIPFAKFQFDGYDHEKAQLGQFSQELVIHTIQIIKESSKNEKFAVQLKEISFSTDFRSYDEMPMFYRSSTFDRGHSSYDQKKQSVNNKDKQNNKSINDFF